MSKSRSVTPTPNIYAPINIPSSGPPPTPSRPHTDDTTNITATPATASAPTAVQENLDSSPAQFTHFHSFVSAQASPDDLIHRRPSPDSPPMAKRMRRHSPEDTSRSRSSDSQSGMADTEEAGGRSPYLETSPPAVAPLKKKRTRTLTTPHQSAVLHALLAQSRFPTTAMREEVGRSIGLSARKVQIWFQNQRQKARRPGSQSDHSQTGPQQYSGFQNAPPAYAAEQPMPHGEREGRVYPHAYSGYPPSEQFLGSDEASPQLLGPGMPGRSPPTHRGRPLLHLASASADPYSRDLPAPPYSSRSLPSASDTSEGAFPLRRMHPDDPSRTLAPLIFSQPSRRTDLHSAPSTSTSSMFAHSAPTTPSYAALAYSPASPSPSPPFAHVLPPGPSAHPQAYAYASSSSSSLGLPPPFTLQPQPQWTSGRERPAATWARTGSGSSPSPPPLRTSARRAREPTPDDGDTPRLGAAQPPPARAGRYDPVRAIFVPYSPTTSPSDAAPATGPPASYPPT
ncbi:hypothetical protein B0H15DRAFT_410897 [Mycena belliarum]|uniref:Homeobox domain-containing protein n=1 Tax=Mycena belliarum TaxID=1033014 RepID=A0AAD6UF83_9AGAR|nr:hypothetical protein B0H15DRAFT_410897 [Mycena belliae]